MEVRSDPVRGQLEWVVGDYAAILKAARPEELDLPTAGTRWTNRQLLFHMLLGQLMTSVGCRRSRRRSSPSMTKPLPATLAVA